mmetsp:Transcript_18801/g.52520  ORF Transcript_18801/g.52520 Transcript_18801/m.52520 type:complete len:227 (-) Transcript_18801:1691-2371(-)
MEAGPGRADAGGLAPNQGDHSELSAQPHRKDIFQGRDGGHCRVPGPGRTGLRGPLGRGLQVHYPRATQGCRPAERFSPLPGAHALCLAPRHVGPDDHHLVGRKDVFGHGMAGRMVHRTQAAAEPHPPIAAVRSVLCLDRHTGSPSPVPGARRSALRGSLLLLRLPKGKVHAETRPPGRGPDGRRICGARLRAHRWRWLFHPGTRRTRDPTGDSHGIPPGGQRGRSR